MSKTKTQKMSMTASLVIAVLAFGGFVGAATLVTKNQLGTTSVSLAGEDDGEDENEDENKDEDEDEDEDKDDDKEDKAKETAKKKSERESAKKQSERSNEDSEDEGDDSGDDNDEDESDDNDSDEDEGDSEDDADEVEGDDDGDDNAMYQDRDKTLSKLQEKIAEAKKEITQKGNEGFDVTAALARLAAAEAAYGSVSGAFDANNLDEVKRLAKEARKLTHFAREDDLHDAEEAAEDVSKVAKRIVQVKKKLAELKALGGDTGSFEAMLAEAEKAFAASKALIASGDTTALSGLDIIERRIKSIKNLVENSIFALGGEDDDFDDDHRSEVADFVKSLNDVADIEEGGIGKQVRTIARAQKLSAEKVGSLMDDVQKRSDFTEFLIGPKTDDLDEIQNEISANTARIVILNRAISQIDDADVKAMLSEQVTTLQQETTTLQSFVTSQLDKSGLFSWLGAFFPKF